MIVLESNSFILMGTVRGQAGFFFPPQGGWAARKYASKPLKQILVIAVEYSE